MKHPFEEVYRAKQIFNKKLGHKKYFRNNLIHLYPNFRFNESLKELDSEYNFSLEKTRTWRIFQVELKDIIEFQSWRTDIKNNITSPEIYSGSISYKNFDLVGESKYVFELNRLHHLPQYAYDAFKNGNKDTAKSLISQVRLWKDQNPLMGSINWTSGIEAGVRAVNLIYTRQYLSHFLEEDDKKLFNDLLKSHLVFLKKNLSLYSSANNHLLGELLGIIHISGFFEYADSTKDFTKFSNFLIREFEKQVDDNGVCRENSIRYHSATYNTYLSCFILMYNKGFPLADRIWNRLMKMNDFLQDFNWGNGIYIGDNDDSELLYSQWDKDYDLIKSISNSREILKEVEKPLDFRNHLVFTGWAKPDLSNYISTSEYSSSGYHKLGNEDVEVIFDVAEIGYDSIAAHGHSDALSVLLSYKSIPFLVDPGTYQYHWKYKEWRDYFKGSFAHNSITIEGYDQALSQGPMLWTIKPSVQLLECQRNFVVGEHDGFKKQGIDLVHRRSVKYFEGILEIKDSLLGSNKSKARVNYHIHPEVMVEKVPEGCRLVHKSGVSILLVTDPVVKLQELFGSMDPIGGWYSPSYDVLHKSCTISFAIKAEKSTTFKTKIIFE